MEELELKLVKDYATKHDLGKLEGKLDSVDRRVASQESTLALVEYKLNGILGALNKILWVIATPLIGGTVAAIVWVVSNMGV